jgi:hypothetical protein
MAVDPSTLEEFDGKQVLLHVVVDGELVEREGKVEAASEQGMAFKEKGKRDVELIEPDQIEEIALAPTKPKTLSQKKLKEVELTTARQHLLDRHGYERSVVNKMTDEQAFADHNDIDHKDLGHRHESEDDEDGDETEGTEEE